VRAAGAPKTSEHPGLATILIIAFPGTEQTFLAQVGGKGYSLIRMVEAGLSVPPGVDLTRCETALPRVGYPESNLRLANSP
jgi:hypothetical protein